MSTLPAEIEKELINLEPESARHFERAVREMLQLVKTSRPQKRPAPFHERISQHPAIGTWPASLNADQHLQAVRNDWEH